MAYSNTLTSSFNSFSGLLKDLYEITKPKVVFMLVITAIVGMVLAQSGWPPLDLLLVSSIGIGLLSAAAAAMNHIVDQKIDAKRARTSNRRIAKGRVTNRLAIIFSFSLAAFGFALLYAFVNPLTAWLTLASLFGYAVVYTLVLKRLTPQNIVIGGLAGAMPPLLGWVSMTGDLHPNAFLLVMIIFTWTPPHFWALAIHRKAEYAKADIPMLPVTHGEAYTKVQILLYTLILLAISVFPFITGMSGYLYLAAAIALGARFIYWAVVMIKNSQPHAAINTFKYSITYLMLLFLALLADHYLMANV